MGKNVVKNEFTEPSGKKSSMRLAVLRLSTIIGFGIIAVILLLGLQIGFGKEPDWDGAAKLIGALAFFIGAILGVKAYQRKFE